MRTCGWKIDGVRCGKETRHRHASYCRECHRLYMKGYDRRRVRKKAKPNPVVKKDKAARLEILSRIIIPNDVAEQLERIVDGSAIGRTPGDKEVIEKVIKKLRGDHSTADCIADLATVNVEGATEKKRSKYDDLGVVVDSIDRLKELL